MSNIRLTIGVPTISRLVWLRRQLERLEAEQLDPSLVEVLVSDNASTDDTPAYMEHKLRHTTLQLAYHRNPVNLGYDGNIMELYRRAKGEYVWFLGDDDLFLPGGAAILLAHLLHQEACGLVVANCTAGLPDNVLFDLVPYSPSGQKVPVRVGVRAAVTDERERLAVVMAASQVSCCVVRRSERGQAGGPGGAHMHERLANLNLLDNPHYFIIPEQIVVGGPMYWSRWFMEATMFGIRDLYAAPDMQFSPAIVDLVSMQTCKVPLKVQQVRYILREPVAFPEMDAELVARLKAHHGAAYRLIEKDVRWALLACKFQSLIRVVVFLLWPVIWLLVVCRRFYRRWRA
ncbi:MAG: glycosyltransferase family 2 protein [Magnetococcus sp. WYHC-3]